MIGTVIFDEEIDFEVKTNPDENNQRGNGWKLFIAEAQTVDPMFHREQLVMSILKQAGHKGFNPKKKSVFLNDLRAYKTWWEDFRERAKEVHPRLYSDPLMIEVALEHNYGPVNFEDNAKMLEACRGFAKDWIRLYGFAMSCPECQSPTVRDGTLDKFCKPHPDSEPAEEVGWRCTVGGKSHFWDYRARLLTRRMKDHHRLVTPDQAQDLEKKWSGHYATIQEEQNRTVYQETVGAPTLQGAAA